MSLRALAREVGVHQSYLSRILGPEGKRESRRASPETARRIAAVFGLPEDYFPEVREDFVVTQVRQHPDIRDRLYSQLRR